MIDQELLSYCHYVYQFKYIRRYSGMMPEHLIRSCDERAFARLFQEGYLAFLEASLENGRKLRGVILTDRGLDLLRRA